MSDFTKGPWEVEGSTLIWSPSTTANVAAVSALRSSEFVKYTRPSIDDMDFPEICANARLIAAAPDLLKACRQAIAALKGREHDGFLRAAIAKATGEQS